MNNGLLLKTLICEQRAAVLADNVILRDQAQNQAFVGREAVQRLLQAMFVDGFADVVVTPLAIVADEQAAVLEFIFRGRQQGAFLGIPATGRDVELSMILICHINEEHIQRATLYYDAGTLLRQLGMAL